MKFLPVSAALFASLLTLVAAKDEIRLPNSFIVPAPGEVLKAGTEYTVRWIADTKGKVKLVLRKGPSTDLDTLGLIAEVENKGSYLWAIDEDLESGTDYALQIIDSSNDDEFNYTSQFTIQSDVPASDDDEDDDKPTSASGSGSATVSRTATADDDSSTTLATVTRSGTSTATESSTASATDDETDAEETDPAEEVEESDGAAGALAVKGLSLVAGVMMVAFFA